MFTNDVSICFKSVTAKRKGNVNRSKTEKEIRSANQKAKEISVPVQQDITDAHVAGGMEWL